jgi:hypothetical protein
MSACSGARVAKRIEWLRFQREVAAQAARIPVSKIIEDLQTHSVDRFHQAFGIKVLRRRLAAANWAASRCMTHRGKQIPGIKTHWCPALCLAPFFGRYETQTEPVPSSRAFVEEDTEAWDA